MYVLIILYRVAFLPPPRTLITVLAAGFAAIIFFAHVCVIFFQQLPCILRDKNDRCVLASSWKLSGSFITYVSIVPEARLSGYCKFIIVTVSCHLQKEVHNVLNDLCFCQTPFTGRGFSIVNRSDVTNKYVILLCDE